MEYFAGIDVSLEASSVCLVDAAGKVIRETKVASDPNALIEHFVSLEFAVRRVHHNKCTGLTMYKLVTWRGDELTHTRCYQRRCSL